jgi:hypothetical protein
MTDRPPSPFQLARDELRAIGIDLTMHPGTYAVNFAHGSTEATAYFSDDLADAIEHGRAMAASRPVIVVRPFDDPPRVDHTDPAEDAAALGAALIREEKPPRRKWRRRKMTPKAQRRRMIRQHNRRMRARALRQHDEKG